MHINNNRIYLYMWILDYSNIISTFLSIIFSLWWDAKDCITDEELDDLEKEFKNDIEKSK